MPDLPQQPGVISGEPVSRDLRTVYQTKLSQAATIHDLEPEFMFYTPALLHLVAKVEVDLVDYFAQEQNLDVRPLAVKFEKPIFSNLILRGDPSWNHVIYGMPKEHWAAFLQYMGSSAFHDAQTKVLYRCRPQSLWVADPFVLSRSVIVPASPPMAQITAFVLDSNQGCWYFEPTTAEPTLLTALPKMVHSPQAYTDTEALARAILLEHPRPYEAADEAQQFPTE